MLQSLRLLSNAVLRAQAQHPVSNAYVGFQKRNRLDERLVWAQSARQCARRIAPLLAEFAAQHSGLEAHLVFSDAGPEVEQDGCRVTNACASPFGTAARSLAVQTQSGVEEIKVEGHMSSNGGDMLHGWALEAGAFRRRSHGALPMT